MAEKWLYSFVVLKYMDGGRWRVTSLDKDWCQCTPIDAQSETLAGLSPDGVVWFRKRDLIKDPINPEQGTLL